MPEILVKAVDVSLPTQPEKALTQCYRAGDPVLVMPDGHPWGVEELGPKFRIVRVSGDIDDIRTRIQPEYSGVGTTVRAPEGDLVVRDQVRRRELGVPPGLMQRLATGRVSDETALDIDQLLVRKPSAPVAENLYIPPRAVLAGAALAVIPVNDLSHAEKRRLTRRQWLYWMAAAACGIAVSAYITPLGIVLRAQTVVTKTVKSSGGDYTSMSGFESSEQADITAATGSDEILEAECYSFNDTTAVNISGWTTAAANYIRWFTPAAERHDGTWSTDKYYLSVTDASGVDFNEPYIRYEGLQIEVTAATTGQFTMIGKSGSNAEVRFEKCIVTVDDSNHVHYGIYSLSSNNVFSIWNCIVMMPDGQIGISAGSGGALTIYSTTVAGYNVCTHGIDVSSGSITAKNCYAGDVTGSSWNGSPTLTTCASADTTGSTGLQNIAEDTSTFTNVTKGSEDFNLPSGSSLVDAGTDTSGDSAPFDFTDDIVGGARGATWDVGAFERIAAGGPPVGTRSTMGAGK